MKISKPTPAGTALTAALLLLSLALVPAALAGKGKPSGGSGSSSISAPVMVTDLNGNGAPNWGDTVSFNVSTTATSQPYVNLVCSGNGVGYDSWKGVFPGSLDTNWNFVLSSGGWTSGAANCTATLGMYTKQGFKPLISTSFPVGS
jgi:hypothetical protein